MKWSTIIPASAIAARCTTALYSQYCPATDICYRLTIPPTTAKSGKGDVYIQINSLVSYTWVGLGLGHQMAGAKIFVVYADGNGNVTVSPRLGRGHYEPQYDGDADFEVLEGSGVYGYRMTAELLCRDCDKWVGGGMNFSLDAGTWIWAAKTGLPLASKNPNQTLQHHDRHGVFSWPYAPAKGGEALPEGDPFLHTPAAPITQGNPFLDHLPPAPYHWNPNDTIPIVHGTIASLALLILFPLGAILIRVTRERRLVWVHAGVQTLAYVLLFAAMAMGIRMASTGHLFNNKHPFIGIAIVLVLFFQAVDGLLHHAQWMRNERRRTWLAYVHIWTGRVCIVLGMVNGGFGLQLAKVQSKGVVVAYGVVAGVSFCVLVGAIAYGERKRDLMLRASREERKRSEVEGMESRFE